MLAPFAQWWTSDLAQEIHENLRGREGNHEMTSLVQWPILSSSRQRQRRRLVDKMVNICERADLLERTVHSAVLYIDKFIAITNLQDTHVHLAALAAILVAAKYHEREENIPAIAVLNTISAQHFSASHVQSMELILLDCLEWNLGEPTIMSFIEYYMIQTVHPDDYHCDQPLGNVDKARKYVKKYAQYFLQICLQEYELRMYVPSCTAAAVIAAIRSCLCLAPTWPKRLETTTGYQTPQIAHCVHKMLLIHDEDRQATEKEKILTASKATTMTTTAETVAAMLTCITAVQAS
ncbi:cyclin-J-like [Corticium candelabrum]|uniref:cyclin-J-like n=1 Tax=Corticium candelabrum TaxID=121492 RepID=UPI002E26D201|nr:cyclin-J-like [Corticium candelabrum]